METQRQVQSVQRALQILRALAATGDRGAGIVELSETVQLPVSTAHRLVTTLRNEDYVIQDVASGRYLVGPGAYIVGSTFRRRTGFQRMARPYLISLVDEINETVNLAIRLYDEALYIDQVQSRQTMKMFMSPGTRVPLVCTGVGKVLLAGMLPFERSNVLSRAATVSSCSRRRLDQTSLDRTIDLVTDQGFALDDEEFEEGIRCVAVPIFNDLRATTAAISASAPAQRLGGERLHAIVDALLRASTEISSRLGWIPPT